MVFEGTDALLLGRVTHDSFAGAWPGREAAGGEDAAFAAWLGDVPKIVATGGGQDLGWRNVERLDGDLVERVTSMKADPTTGRVLVPGSISVVRQLLLAYLLDELRPVSYTHLRAHETVLDLVCRLLLEKKKTYIYKTYLYSAPCIQC